MYRSRWGGPLSSKLSLVMTLIIGVAAVGVMAYIFIVAPILDKQRQGAAQSAFGDKLMSTCQAVPTQRGSAPTTSGTARLLVLETGTNRVHIWQSQLPDSRRAASADQVDVVICIKETQTTMGTCQYGLRTRTRIQYTYDMAAVDPKTGVVFGNETFQGGLPRPCPSDSNSSAAIYGSEPDLNSFIAWADTNIP